MPIDGVGRRVKLLKLASAVALALAAAACGTISVEERESVREEISLAEEETLAKMIERKPEIQAALDQAHGYLVAQLSHSMHFVVAPMCHSKARNE